MSLDIYKALNNELVSKLQEYKKSNAFLEREIIFLNQKYQEEHELRIDERSKFLSVISRLRSNLDDVEAFILGEEIAAPASTYSESQGSTEERRRTRSSGVTNRSPIRKSYQQSDHDNSNSETQDENAEMQKKVNCWGFPNIEEVNSQPEIGCVEEVIASAEALSRLSINDERLQCTNVHETQSSNESNTVIQISNDSEINIARTLQPSVERSEIFDCLRTPIATDSSSTSINGFFNQAVHSTPYNRDVDEVTITPTETQATIAASACNTMTVDNSTATVSMRPRRNCAPGSLVEPSTRTKLRNENATCKGKNKRITRPSKTENKEQDVDNAIRGSCAFGDSTTDETENLQNHLNVEHSTEQSNKVLNIKKDNLKKKRTVSKIKKGKNKLA